MRKELELIQLIENYLKGNLSEADRFAFEKRMSTDTELQKEVQLQSDLLNGIERTGLKQSASKAFKKYKFKKNLKNWGQGGLTLTIIALSSIILYKTLEHPKENAAQPLPELNEQGEKLWIDADKYLPLQNFELNTDKDTVVETKDGIVIAIPAHSFLTANGQLVTGSINLEVKEALHASDIMKAGLNTRSGDQLLETGGMFYINARQEGKSLKIDPKNSLRAQIPTDEVKPGMQLFEGKRMSNGTIDWVNPKPVEKDLIPVDILSLNFYPPAYLDSLRSWGYNDKDKKFTDSLYYSFAKFRNTALEKKSTSKPSKEFYSLSDDEMVRELTTRKKDTDKATIVKELSAGEKIFKQNCAVCHSLGKNKITGPGLQDVTYRVPSDEWLKAFISNNKKLISSGDAYAKAIFEQNNLADMTVFESTISQKDMNALIDFLKENDHNNFISASLEKEIHGINPARIKAIWDTHFQNTILATKEFEERIAFIHKTCSESVLNTYVTNLNKNLSAIDSTIAIAHPEFQRFAVRGDGKVKNGDKNTELLKKYYLKKSKIYTEAITKTQNEFWNKQRELDQESTEKNGRHREKENERVVENYEKELDINLTEAYRQLGKEKTSPVPSGTYAVSITSTGWSNVDKYVKESLASRTTLDYTDPASGKKATIKYGPITVTIKDYKNYDRVLAYLLPDELNSFMRVENKNGVFEEKVTNVMLYKLVCIAYKGEASFYYSHDNVKPGSLSISLIETSNADIQDSINKYGKLSQVKAMNDELNYEVFTKQEDKRQSKLIQLQELTDKTKAVIFPCMIAKKDSTKTHDFAKYYGVKK